MSPVQGRQVCVPALQTGVVPAQLAFVTHPTQICVVVLHTGVAPVHWVALPGEHWPHAPDDSHAGVAPPHSPSPTQARHVCVVAVLQTGVVPPHWAFVKQEAQVPVPVLQTGVAPVHCMLFVAEQTPQAPVGSQAGVAPPQSPSPAHARHVCVVPLQMGVVPPQSAFAVHRTHVPAPVSQTGVPPVHCVAFPAEHWPQAPDGSQAGIAPPHSPSPPQARHVKNAGSQMGFAPAQSAFARQPTHVFVVGLHSGVAPPHVELSTHATHVAVPTSQAGVAPPQWAVLEAEHSPQAPLTRHTGLPAEQSASAAHARQVFVPASHVGFVPAQLVLVRHPTHRRGEAVVRQNGVAPPQSESWAQPSIVMGVGGAPGPPPLPSEI